MIKPIAMPHRITYDQVAAALNTLGLDTGNHIEVTMSTEEVTVKVRTSGGTLARAYVVNGPADRYSPKDAHPTCPHGYPIGKRCGICGSGVSA